MTSLVTKWFEHSNFNSFSPMQCIDTVLHTVNCTSEAVILALTSHWQMSRGRRVCMCACVAGGRVSGGLIYWSTISSCKWVFFAETLYLSQTMQSAPFRDIQIAGFFFFLIFCSLLCCLGIPSQSPFLPKQPPPPPLHLNLSACQFSKSPLILTVGCPLANDPSAAPKAQKSQAQHSQLEARRNGTRPRSRGAGPREATQ